MKLNVYRMVYFKFVGNSDLDIATGETCGGGRCPDFRVIINSGDLSDGDCRQRLYGGSLNMTKVCLHECF
jgi:hypothetical protein